MKKTCLKFILGAFVTLSFLLPLNAMAQDNPPPLAEEWLVTVKQGHMAEFLKAVKAHGEFRAAHGDTRDWQIYTAMLADGLNKVAIRYCCFNWSDQDAYVEWGRANPHVFEHWMTTADPHIEKIEHYFEETDWANSHWEEGDFRYFAVTSFELKPGHAGDYDAARDKMSQIAINQGWVNGDRSWIWASQIGGPPMEYIVVPHKNFASLGGGEQSFLQFLSEKMGSEEAAAELMQQFASATQGSSFQIWEYHHDLSMHSED